jgi:hypothetical protein
MLDSVGGIITIGCFLLFFVIFGLLAHRRASATPAPDEPHEWADNPIIFHVPLIPVVDIPRPWADIMVSCIEVTIVIAPP